MRGISVTVLTPDRKFSREPALLGTFQMSAKSLTSRELHNLSRAAAELYQFRNKTELGHGMNSLVGRFVAVEYSMGWDSNLRSPQETTVYASAEGLELARKMAPIYGHYVAKYPDLSSRIMDPKRKGQTARCGEVFSYSKLQRIGYLDEYARPGSCEFQIAYFFKNPGHRTRMLSCNRNRREFTDKEVAIVKFLAPHFQSAYENCLAFEERAEQAARASAVRQIIPYELIWLDENLAVLELTPRIPQLIKEFFGQEIRFQQLPRKLMDWLREWRASAPAEPLRPLMIRKANASLKLRYYPQQLPGLNLLTFHRQTIAPDIEDIRPLGLSQRESEVLQWVSQGKTNDEIGIILGISGLTVKKHVEHLFEKLGVNNRVSLAMTHISEL